MLLGSLTDGVSRVSCEDVASSDHHLTTACKIDFGIELGLPQLTPNSPRQIIQGRKKSLSAYSPAAVFHELSLYILGCHHSSVNQAVSYRAMITWSTFGARVMVFRHLLVCADGLVFEL